MFVACVIVSVLLAVILVVSAAGKLTRTPQVVAGMDRAGVPVDWFRWLAIAELAGAIGLIVGLAVGWIGVVAAIGVIVYFVGAVTFHVRAKDWAGLGPPVVIGILAIVALWLRLATL